MRARRPAGPPRTPRRSAAAPRRRRRRAPRPSAAPDRPRPRAPAPAARCRPTSAPSYADGAARLELDDLDSRREVADLRRTADERWKRAVVARDAALHAEQLERESRLLG